jgi:hypothetical protein
MYDDMDQIRLCLQLLAPPSIFGQNNPGLIISFVPWMMTNRNGGMNSFLSPWQENTGDNYF